MSAKCSACGCDYRERHFDGCPVVTPAKKQAGDVSDADAVARAIKERVPWFEPLPPVRSAVVELILDLRERCFDSWVRQGRNTGRPEMIPLVVERPQVEVTPADEAAGIYAMRALQRGATDKDLILRFAEHRARHGAPR